MLHFTNGILHWCLGMKKHLWIFTLLATYTPGWLASVDNITSSSILIQWNNLTSFINRELLHYIVFLSSSDGSAPYYANVDGSRLDIEIYGLDHSQRYHMEVFGVDALGYCYKTLELNATTKKGKAIRYELRSFFVIRLGGHRKLPGQIYH